jgi:hypothetical protein
LKSLFQNSNAYYDAPTALQKLAHPEEVLYDQTHWYILQYDIVTASNVFLYCYYEHFVYKEALYSLCVTLKFILVQDKNL